MNSVNQRSQNAQKAAAPLHNYQFDFGLSNSAFSKSSSSLNAQKQKQHHHPPPPPPPSSSSSNSAPPQPSWTTTPSSSTSWTSNTSLNVTLNRPARSMVGDVSGKSWGSMPSSDLSNSGLPGGLSRGASADLFGDLVGGSLGRSSAPLNQTVKVSPASRPKGVSLKDSKTKSSEPVDSISSQIGNASKTADSLDDWGAFESFTGTNRNAHDPSLAKRSHDLSSGQKGGDDVFGEFQEGSSYAASASGDPFAASATVNLDLFGNFAQPSKLATDDFFSFAPNVRAADTPEYGGVDSFGFSQSSGTDPFSSLLNDKSSNVPIKPVSDPFESLLKKTSSPNLAAPAKAADPLMEALWSSTKAHSGASPQQLDEWGLETDFGGNDDGAATVELEELPPPPPGVNFMIARDKGSENYKQGQFAAAIKWLSWAEKLMGSSENDSMLIDVLSCKASCLKEVGEYKKAVADCTKVLELDTDNMAVLLQRALLYESTEKYKLCMADLREVLKVEPQNRVASNTLARLRKMDV